LHIYILKNFLKIDCAKVNLSFPIFSCPFYAKPYKYEANEELPVVIAPFMKNTDFMRVSDVQTSKVGKLR
jgi:hypothetical protein